MAEIYWIESKGPGRVALMPRPRGGGGLEEEIRSLRLAEKVDVLVSLLETKETWELGLADEARLAEKSGMEFVSHPIPDHSIPTSEEETRRVISKLAGRVKKGKRVAIHCRAGIGRSGLISGCVLLEGGLPLDQVLERLAEARGFPVPETPDQHAWLARYGERR
jgi:protein-tyrosine phosphatase